MGQKLFSDMGDSLITIVGGNAGEIELTGTDIGIVGGVCADISYRVDWSHLLSCRDLLLESGDAGVEGADAVLVCCDRLDLSVHFSLEAYECFVIGGDSKLVFCEGAGEVGDSLRAGISKRCEVGLGLGQGSLGGFILLSKAGDGRGEGIILMSVGLELGDSGLEGGVVGSELVGFGVGVVEAAAEEFQVGVSGTGILGFLASGVD